jgi:glucose/arabinose dehydrogenase
VAPALAAGAEAGRAAQALTPAGALGDGPVGLAVGADDALYFDDDAGQTVWRITRD